MDHHFLSTSCSCFAARNRVYYHTFTHTSTHSFYSFCLLCQFLISHITINALYHTILYSFLIFTLYQQAVFLSTFLTGMAFYGNYNTMSEAGYGLPSYQSQGLGTAFFWGQYFFIGLLIICLGGDTYLSFAIAFGTLLFALLAPNFWDGFLGWC